MARIVSNTGTYAQKIEKFLGLNECKTGDSLLKMGEAAKLENFKISKEFCLQIRPGTHTVVTLSEDGDPVRGLWTGTVGGTEYTLAACGGHVWNVTGMTGGIDLGTLTDDETQFFGMNGNVYILNGHEYKYWTGSGQIQEVEGYVPCVITAAKPSGGGTTLENYNLLSASRRQRFSADGTSKDYHLTEYPITGVSRVTINDAETTAYTVNNASGVITFTTAPAEGLSNVEVTYSVAEQRRDLIYTKRFHEFYNGTTDTRVFLYGDGSNLALYNGLDENGVSRADYFPALNEIQVGAANTPITGMIRHYSRMLAFKPNETYKVEYSAQTLADNTVIAGFYVKPINRELGHEALGQVYLCDNNPLSLCSGAVYEWKLYYSSAVVDERSSKRISERVETSLQNMDLKSCITYDDRWNYEYWITYDGTALIYNYAADVWYKYTGLPQITGFTLVHNLLYFATADGKIMVQSSAYRSDDGANISAYWESGSMDFDVPWKKKWSKELFVGLRATGDSALTVTAMSDVKGEYYAKELSLSVNGFDHIDFAHFSFLFRTTQKSIRARIRVPRFRVYKLIFSSDSDRHTATVTDVTIMTRMPRKVR